VGPVPDPLLLRKSRSAENPGTLTTTEAAIIIYIYIT
jgi:hypothetical protein